MRVFLGGEEYSVFLYNWGKLAKRGGGYPQALPKVISLQGMLELPEILVLVRSPSLYSYDTSLQKINVRKNKCPFFLVLTFLKTNLPKSSHKKRVSSIVYLDFSKKSLQKINVRFFYNAYKNDRKKPDIYFLQRGIS